MQQKRKKDLAKNKVQVDVESSSNGENVAFLWQKWYFLYKIE